MTAVRSRRLALGLARLDAVLRQDLSADVGWRELLVSMAVAGAVHGAVLGGHAGRAGQIVTSAYYVTKMILAPANRVDPRIVRFRSDQPNEVAEVVLGNSITLTPGTLTLQIRDGHFVVHALTKAGAQDIVNGDMDRRVAELRRL